MKTPQAVENATNEAFASSSRFSQADNEFCSQAVEMEDLSSSIAGSLSLDSDSIGHDKAKGCKRNEPIDSYKLYTRNEEITVLKTFDRRLVLFIALLYMLSFLDRSSTWSLLLLFCC